MKIYKDNLGLYTKACGWISRPFYGTMFKEGDTVRTHHFGGSTLAGVTFEGEKFTKNGNHEFWSTTGINSYEYKDLSDSYKKETTEWYKDHNRSLSKIYTKRNLEFKDKFKI